MMHVLYVFLFSVGTYISTTSATSVDVQCLIDEIKNFGNISTEQLSDTSLTNPNGHVKFPVPDSDPPLTLTFWRFGSKIPTIEFYLATDNAGKRAEANTEKHGDDPIAWGIFKHNNHFANGDSVNLTIADHSQVGRPMTWHKILDTVIGIALFPMLSQRETREADFWIDVEGVDGEVGWGSMLLHRRVGVDLSDDASVQPMEHSCLTNLTVNII